jgi:penicillin amidase
MPTTRLVALALSLPLLALIPACGGSSAAVDGAVPDAPIPIADASGPDATSFSNLPIDEEVKLAGLTAAVDVVRDVRGVPHIYGKNVADVLRVEGFLMARDRFPQMEFVRRGVLGRLSEVAGDVVANFTLPIDEGARLAGYGREGKAVYDSLADDDPTKVAAIAFVGGVNAYIDEILNATDLTAFEPPQAQTDLDIIYQSPAFGHWDPADLFAFARYLSTSLSFDTSDIDTSRAQAGVTAAYGSDPTANRRAGAFVDMYGFWPARKVYSRNGFAQAPAKRASAAKPTAATPATPASKRAAKLRPVQPLDIASLDGARKFLQAQNSFLGYVQKGMNGSNNWMVSGAHTASGHSILANDLHL